MKHSALAIVALSLALGACSSRSGIGDAVSSVPAEAVSSFPAPSSSAASSVTAVSASSRAASSKPATMDLAPQVPVVTKGGASVETTTDPSAVVIPVTADNFAFSPNAVTFKKGEKAILRFMGKAGKHGVAIPALGINVVIPENGYVDVAIPTDKTGTYDFRCSVPCGSGHRDMTGKIVIE